jgi:hypothetical protein
MGKRLLDRPADGTCNIAKAVPQPVLHLYAA